MIGAESPLPRLPLWLATLIALGTEAAVIAGLSNWPAPRSIEPPANPIEVSLVSASALVDSAAAGAVGDPPEMPPDPAPEPESEPEPEPESVPEPDPQVPEVAEPLAVPRPEVAEPLALTPPRPKVEKRPDPKPKPKPKPKSRPPVPNATPSRPVEPDRGRSKATSGVTGGGKTPGKGAEASGASVPAAYLSNPAPRYPSSARRQRQEGTVHLRVLVNARGRPSEVRIANSSGVSSLDEAALRAVRRWRFRPARRNGESIAAWVRIPVRFTLDR